MHPPTLSAYRAASRRALVAVQFALASLAFAATAVGVLTVVGSL